MDFLFWFTSTHVNSYIYTKIIEKLQKKIKDSFSKFKR